MKKSVTTKKGLEIDIRMGNSKDVAKILALNDKFTKKEISTEDRKHGFLLSRKYNAFEILKIIGFNELVVCFHGDLLIGYFLNDNFSQHVQRHKNAIEYLKKENIINTHAKVSLRTQIVVDKEYQRQSIPFEMLNYIIPFMKPKYDYLFSIGRVRNPKRIAHEKAGWEIIFEDAEFYYCILSVAGYNS